MTGGGAAGGRRPRPFHLHPCLPLHRRPGCRHLSTASPLPALARPSPCPGTRETYPALACPRELPGVLNAQAAPAPRGAGERRGFARARVEEAAHAAAMTRRVRGCGPGKAALHDFFLSYAPPRQYLICLLVPCACFSTNTSLATVAPPPFRVRLTRKLVPRQSGTAARGINFEERRVLCTCGSEKLQTCCLLHDVFV